MSDGDQVVRKVPSPIEVLTTFLKSSVGAKVVMGITGLVLWGFVLGHVLGNLQVFQGAEPLNAYGAFLHGLAHGAGIWAVRAVMITVVVAHIFFGIRLARLNRAARPVGYRVQKSRRTNLASMTMAVSGLLILGFIVFHLLHFTVGSIQPEFYHVDMRPNANGRHDVFDMVVNGFKTPWIVAVYVVGQAVLLSHLIHGTVSLWQSLGLHHNVWTPAMKVIGRGLAVFIVGANIAIPVAIFFFWT
jgi:succinate dehydrogenase / fumarate reductase cytochrome b subunit